MRLSCRRRKQTGFTLLELLVVLAITGAFILATLPAFLRWVERGRVLAAVRSVSSQMQLARGEAIKAQAPVVVQPDYTTQELLIFVNVDNDVNLLYQPDPAKAFKTADYEIASVSLPADDVVQFWSPLDGSPEGATAIDAFTVTGAPLNAAVFMPNGSISDVGALRFGDQRGNFFEVKVAPRATGRVEILKQYPTPPWGSDPVAFPNDFYPRGRHPTADIPMWSWF